MFEPAYICLAWCTLIHCLKGRANSFGSGKQLFTCTQLCKYQGKGQDKARIKYDKISRLDQSYSVSDSIILKL